MDHRKLDGKKIAILVAQGFEQVEMTEPRKALEDAGAETDLVSPEASSVHGWNHLEWGDSFRVDVSLDQASADDYDALVLPGGVMNPDHLRQDARAIRFVRAFFESGKPVGAICHGPWMLVEADVVRGRHVTSWPSLKTDLRNAGGHWTDEPVVTDRGLITSRKPADIPQFNAKLIEEFAEGIHPANSRRAQASLTTEQRSTGHLGA